MWHTSTIILHPQKHSRLKANKIDFNHTNQVVMDNTLQVTMKNAVSPRPFPRAAGASLTFFPRAAFLACISWKRASLARRFYVLRNCTVQSE